MELDHPNIIKIHEIIETEYQICIVQELCLGGELCLEMKKATDKGQTFTEKDASQVFRQLSSALIYLHSFNIIHADMKPENVMLKYPNDFSTVKIIDFGFSRFDSNAGTNQRANQPHGTVSWNQPSTCTLLLR